METSVGTNTPIDSRYKRVLSLRDLVLLGLSMTIGSGIFVLIDDVAKYSHNWLWLSMFLAGLMSLLTAMSYGELASLFPNNLGEYGYIKQVSDPITAKLAGIVVLVSDVFIIATVALGLGQHLSQIIGTNVMTTAIALIVILNYLNFKGIQTASQVSNQALYLKLSIIGLIIVSCFVTGSPQEPLFQTQKLTTSGLSTASIIAIFAYLGFNNMTNLAEETINPTQTVGQSMVITVGLVTVIYTLLTLASMFVITSTDLSQSVTPLATITERLFGSHGFTLCLILAIVSLMDTLLVSSVSESRYIHGYLSQVSPSFGQADMNPNTRTPYLSIVVLVILTSVVIYMFKNIGVTAVCGDLLIMVIFIVVNLIVIILRYRQPDLPRPFKVPLNWGSLPLPSVMAIIIGLYAIYQLI